MKDNGFAEIYDYLTVFDVQSLKTLFHHKSETIYNTMTPPEFADDILIFGIDEKFIS
ncbi:MAG: hypothetical protein R2883_05065 [Caldisericia bacterium]